MKKQVKNTSLLTEAPLDMTKAELKDFVKDVFSSEINKQKITDENRVREIVKELLKKHYKVLWTKSMYVIDEL